MKNIYKQKPWLEYYDRFVPPSLPYSTLNIPQMLEKTSLEFPDSICLDYLGREYSYHQINCASDSLAKWLSFYGVKRGERVGVIFPNSPQFVISFFAVLKIGGIVVAMNPLYKEPEFRRIIQDCDVRCLICMEDQYCLLQDLVEQEQFHCLVISKKEDFIRDDPLDGSYEKIEDTEIRSIQNPTAFTDCIRKEIRNITLDFSFSSETPAIFQYTGGTTGTPKAAIGLHKNIIANTLQFLTWCDLQVAAETFVAMIPLYHVYGMVLAMVLGIRIAAKLLLFPDPRDQDFVLQSITDKKATFFPGVPNFYASILSNKKLQAGKYDLRSIKACISGSAPLPARVKAEFERITGGKLVEGYGLSEAPTATHCNPLMGQNKSGSFGLPLPDVECMVVDVENDQKIVDCGEQGELLIRGPQVMAGYFQNRSESKLALRNGWLHTGDIVHMDEQGYFYFVDRKKDLIKVGGFQVWPNEIEEVLLQIRGVKNAVVAGIHEETGDEKVIAWLMLDEGTPLESETVRDHCREFLAAYKIPKEVIFVDEIPRTSVGKILRRELVKRYDEKRS